MRWCFAIACVALSCGSAFAQSDRGTITGTVTDPAGAVVASAPIQARNTGTGVVYPTETSATGNYTIAQLPPGTYEVMPQEHGWDPSKDESRPEKRRLPGVFIRKSVTLNAGDQPEQLEIRAVPHVVIEAQYYDGKGQKTRGHAGHMFGQIDKNNFWFAEAKMDNNGKMTILAPHGLTQARLTLMTNEHGVLRHRMKKDGPLSTAREIDLGTLDDDVKGIEIIRYVAPILIGTPRTRAANRSRISR